MGVNLFVEGRPLPVVIRVRLPRQVEDLKDLKEVISAINLVESFYKRNWPIFWQGSEYRFRRTKTKLISFRVDSPPEFQIFTDPAWIAVFVAILTNYKGLKASINEIKRDVKKIGFVIKGLSARELELLDIAVRLTLDRIFESNEEKARKFEKFCSKIRHQLLGREAEPPEIFVKKIEDDWQG